MTGDDKEGKLTGESVLSHGLLLSMLRRCSFPWEALRTKGESALIRSSRYSRNSPFLLFQFLRSFVTKWLTNTSFGLPGKSGCKGATGTSCLRSIAPTYAGLPSFVLTLCIIVLGTARPCPRVGEKA